VVGLITQKAAWLINKLLLARAVNDQNALEITKKWLRPVREFGR
jgi:hypothetical protein